MQREFSYPKDKRLLKRRDYLRVQGNAEKIATKNFLLLYRKSTLDRSRLGVVVTKKFDKRAVKRNAVKRRVKEFFRLNYSNISGSFDFVIIARKNASLCRFEEVESQLLGALKRGKLLDAGCLTN